MSVSSTGRKRERPRVRKRKPPGKVRITAWLAPEPFGRAGFPLSFEKGKCLWIGNCTKNILTKPLFHYSGTLLRLSRVAGRQEWRLWEQGHQKKSIRWRNLCRPKNFQLSRRRKFPHRRHCGKRIRSRRAARTLPQAVTFSRKSNLKSMGRK